MKKVIITGASGMLGRALVAEFTKQSWDVLGLAYSRAEGALKKVDLRDGEAVRNVFKEFKPAVVVHAAVERKPDVVENQEEEARKINVTATETVAKTCAEIGAFLVFFSTDYVFDGTKPPYKPGDAPNPLNKYGIQKVEGEKVVQATQPNSAILRVPILYGQVEFLKESAVTVLAEALLDTSKQAKMCDYQIRFPTYTKDLAVVCRQLAEKHLQDPTIKGLFHWSSTERMTKYSMVTVIADIFGLSHDHLIANKEPPTGTPRPYNCQLDTSALEAFGIIGQRTPYRDGIKECLEPYMKK
ncbi:methionine adenosyltransferase 2 subunit beta-like [Amphiura filiformis]|uniref:methionine adenosyltransferase 2 subunit beta-like n=1 Tax=Amphiura filiformis TaxID=82378 RepID=UPI003B2180C0